MTQRYILSPRAQSDLEEIWDYTARQWGIDQAEIYIRQLWRDVEAVAANPAIGRPCPEVRTGYHKFRSGSHVIFFSAERWWHRCCSDSSWADGF